MSRHIMAINIIYNTYMYVCCLCYLFCLIQFILYISLCAFRTYSNVISLTIQYTPTKFDQRCLPGELDARQLNNELPRYQRVMKKMNKTM